MLTRISRNIVAGVSPVQEAVRRLATGANDHSGVTESINAINKEIDDLFGLPNTAEATEGVHEIPIAGTAPQYHDAANPSAPPSQHNGAQTAAWTDKQTYVHAGGTDGLTHVDSSGKASMVDVSYKAITTREARASASVLLGSRAFKLVAANQMKKGDVLTVAQLAGIMGAKHTSLLIPLCHPLALSKVAVELQLDAERDSIHIHTMAKTDGKTGVEMEALTAASVAALTVYDMCKAVSKDIVITDIRLDAKSGGNSADYVREGVH